MQIAGGDALNGRVVGHEWLLRGHSGYIEVNRGFWIYSFIHALTTIASFAVFFAWSLYRWCRTFWYG